MNFVNKLCKTLKKSEVYTFIVFRMKNYIIFLK